MRGLSKIKRLYSQDPFPLPRVDETFDVLGVSQFFATLDLCSGYWQVELDPKDKEKTTFTTTRGHFQIRVTPFCLCNAPATFQRLMELVLRGLAWETCLIYLDDIIFARSFDEHLGRLGIVLDRIRKAGLKLKPNKCLFARKRVGYLGHIVSRCGISTDPSKVTKIRQWPIPRSSSDVRTFLGFMEYYRRFTTGYASIASPLTQLTEKTKRFEWSSDAAMAFETLKTCASQAPVLVYPRFDLEFCLKTDASAVAVGAVLTQDQDGQERPVGFASRKLKPAERNYSTIERDACHCLGNRVFLPVPIRTEVQDHHRSQTTYLSALH